MTSYVHLRRYGKKPGSAEVASIDVCADGQVVYRGNRYDLRTGEKVAKHPGFGHHVDGRFLQWNASDNTLEIHNAEGRIAAAPIYGGKHIAIVGVYLVFNDDSRQPWMVVDTKSGELVGRVED